MIEAPPSHDGARHLASPLTWLRGGPAVLPVGTALDQVRHAPTILHAIRTVPALLAVVDEEVVHSTRAAALLDPILEAIDDERDTVTALAAIHALARIPGPDAAKELVELVEEATPGYEAHALWAIGGHGAAPALLDAVARAVARGPLSSMHAQRALASWARADADAVLAALETTLSGHESPDARRYLAESIGLVPSRAATAALTRIALDPAEHIAVRATAIAAFAERPHEPLPSPLLDLAGATSELSAVVRSTRAQRQLARRGPRAVDPAEGGIRVAQVHLGEAGGVATLLPQLGASLASSPRIAEVVTIVRATDEGSVDRPSRGTGHRLEPLALRPGDGASFSTGWPSLVAVTRGIRAALLAGPRPDVLHLRMADPGSLAGAHLAEELGIPIVFTLAPDPHGPIAAAEAAGSLDRRTFVSADARDGLWFRADLVGRLARRARQLVLFPRAGRAEELEALTGVDLTSGPPRHTIVPEGIDVARIDAAASIVREASESDGLDTPGVIGELATAIARLPRHRHGLPLVVSVGRLHAVKGMSRLVEAFAFDAHLAARANLVIVGGRLESPSAAEAAELERIRQLLERNPELDERLVLLGHRPHDDVALVLATARRGWGALIGSSGVYACASAKEEFGLAIVEAMAAGLPVVAPAAGGPATYVEPAVTGILVDTTHPGALAGAIGSALDLALDGRSAAVARAAVERRYRLERVARDLGAVYRVAAGPRSLAAKVASAWTKVA